MNLIPSLLIYNPLESLVIVLSLSFVSNICFKFKSIIINSYIIGIINLLFQFIVELTYGMIVYSLLTLVLNFVIMPIFIYNYSVYFIGLRLKFSTVYFVLLCFHFSSIINILLLNGLSIIDVFIEEFIMSQELLMNMFVRIPQFLILGVINFIKRRFKNEKVFKEICRQES